MKRRTSKARYQYISLDTTKRRYRISFSTDAGRFSETGFITLNDAIKRFNEVAKDYGMKQHAMPRFDPRDKVKQLIEKKGHNRSKISPFRDVYVQIDELMTREIGDRHPFTKQVVLSLIRDSYTVGYHKRRLCIHWGSYWTVENGKLKAKPIIPA